MLSFLKKTNESAVPDTSATTANKLANKPNSKSAAHPLDGLTGGAFSAPTSGDRAAKVREWLATNPSPEKMQEVFKELSSKDKGAAKPLREKLDDIKRAGVQEHIGQEWAEKANALLAQTKLNIADALAWQRDAAKAGAPLSKEPLASVKVQLNERIKLIEDLQHRAQVQRESAMMMAQRIEVLSTKPWTDAQTVRDVLLADVTQWQTQADALNADAHWPSVDAKFAPQLDSAKSQLLTLWEAFQAALAQAVAASADAIAPLPAVPVWAEAIRAARGEAMPKIDKAEKSARPKIDPEIRSKATSVVREQLSKLEHELNEGHGKASVAAANAVRAALKEHGGNIGEKLDSAAQHALGAAGELEGWQRWRANQIREDLTVKAVQLVKEPLGGRKQQEAVRNLRDAWKQTDQGGVPNHGMWKRFDDACNEAYKLVEAWLEKVKAEEGEHKAQRLQIIENIKIWTAEKAELMQSPAVDWKDINRVLHQMSEDWRNGGHVGEKAFAELQPLYKEAIKAAHGPLDAAQAASLTRRHAMIDEARALGEQPMMRIDAVKHLQQRWQQEAQSVPIERKQEQKLWDAFRKPIDDVFNRKSAEREQAAAAMSAHDKAVLDAARALDEANTSGDGQKIRAAIAALEAAGRGQLHAAPAQAAQASVAFDLQEKQAAASVDNAQAATETVANTADDVATTATDSADPAAELTAQASADTASNAAAGTPTPAASDAQPEADTDTLQSQAAAEPVAANADASAPVAPPKPAKPVVAMRGDDRPGAKKTEAAPAGRFGDKFGANKGGGGKFGDRNDRRDGNSPGGRPTGLAGPGGPGGRDAAGGGRFGDRSNDRGSDRGPGGLRSEERFDDRGPRLSNTAYYAQRDALERGQAALKKLASQAHGESLTALLGAWQQRSPDAVPNAQELGRAVNASTRTAWVQTLSKPPATKVDAATALLRLEMASEAPTPAEHLSARRMLQLQLLTKRNDPPPAQTWGQDAATVMASGYDASNAKRLQTALKALLR